MRLRLLVPDRRRGTVLLAGLSRRSRSAFVACGLAAAVFALPAPASAAVTPQLIVVEGTHLAQLGRWKPYANPAFAKAVAAYGSPSRKYKSGPVCVAVWSALGIVASFTTPFEDCATNGWGFAMNVTLSGANGRARWKTRAGLRVGDAASRIRQLYPSATSQGSTWYLPRKLSVPFGAPVKAAVSNGKIAGLIIQVADGTG